MPAPESIDETILLPQLNLVTIGELGCLCAGVMVVLAKEIEGCRDVATPIEDVSAVLIHGNDLPREPVNFGQVVESWVWCGVGPPAPSPSSRACPKPCVYYREKVAIGKIASLTGMNREHGPGDFHLCGLTLQLTRFFHLQPQFYEPTDGFGAPGQIFLLSAPVIDTFERRQCKADVDRFGLYRRPSPGFFSAIYC